MPWRIGVRTGSAIRVRAGTSVHSTTVRSAGISALSLAAEGAPVAKTLTARSAGCRSSSVRSAGTILARRPVHAVRESAPGPQMREMQRVVQAGHAD